MLYWFQRMVTIYAYNLGTQQKTDFTQKMVATISVGIATEIP